ncbi:MAG: energy transducer TonB, partial [Acidobacteriota bacterium]|nr:energy transducer TonB [Acidobacteriota bacterium]
MQRILNFFLPIILGMAMLAGSLTAQQFAYSVNYSFDLKDATDAPKLGKLPRIEFPDEAVKKGIDGKMVVDVTLSADGKVGGIEFLESLPFGYEDEIRDAFRTFEFTPASNKGTAIDVVL